MPDDERAMKPDWRLRPSDSDAGVGRGGAPVEASAPAGGTSAEPGAEPDADADADATRILPATAPLVPPVVAPLPLPSAANSQTNPPTRPRPAESADKASHPDSGLPRAAESNAQTLPGAAQPGAPAVRQVGRYIIQERLGRGGMATVFRAHDPQIDRDVAIKFLHATLCEDDEYRSRFLREARAAGGLSHPNIVTVHDVGEIEGRPYMAMELLDGAPLADEMASNQPMPVREVVIMGIQLARALAYAHARGIVHRDIKPGNLMRVKGTQTIKVTDFGIAHMESVGSEHRTRVGDILGTPQYMSPEQAQGERLDGRSDLFSTGILLYQMLTGQRPFLGDSLVALAVKIAKEEPIPIEKLRPDLPAALRRVVERCLAKAPDRRFQTGEELADALGRILVDVDESARESNRPRIVPLRVKWAGMMALIVAGVMAFTAMIVTQRQYAAMEGQIVDSGAAMARFIAAQNADSAVLKEWEKVDATLQEIMKTGDFASIDVIDREGIVRASSTPDRVGQPSTSLPAGAPGKAAGDSTFTRQRVGGESVLGFQAPINYRDKPFGRVALALREQPLIKVKRDSFLWMALLVVVTVLAVAGSMYVVANWFAQPIKLVGESMGEIAKGRFDHRIREQRNDEFGLLYAAFDRMAQGLQDRQAGAAVPTPTTTVSTMAHVATDGAPPSTGGGGASGESGLPAQPPPGG